MSKPRESIGITRKVDVVGRVSIPAEYRRELNIDVEDELEIRLVLLSNKEKVIEIKKKGKK